jgi:hypothetical protein
MKTRMLVNRILLIAILLCVGFQASVTPASAKGGKQIVLIMNDRNLRFISVSISGTNQNNKNVTWSKTDQAGFMLAYTKDWWWVEDFVQIDLVYKDSRNVKISDTCLFDALKQPTNTPRVEITYTPQDDCIGGEAGSARDPIVARYIRLRDAFNQIDYYLSDFDMNRFMDILYKEINAGACVAGVATAVYSGGWSYALAAPLVGKYCETTGKKILETFFTKP